MAKRLKLDHVAVHTAAMKSYLVHYCQDLPFFKKASGALRARDWKLLTKIASELDESLLSLGTWSGTGPTEVWTPYGSSEFERTSQFVAMLSKYPFDQKQLPGLDPDAAAIKGFLSNERRNRRVNTVLRGYRTRGIDRHPSHTLMREWIGAVMGQKPDFDYIYKHCDFSSGASLGVRGKATHFGNKVARELTSSPAALKYFTRAVYENEQLLYYYSCEARAAQGQDVVLDSIVCLLTPGELRDYFEETVKLVQEDDLACVPKKFDKSRTIGVPATCNTFIQKGTDLMMRRNLRDRANIDLKYQCVNQVMAREGSSWSVGIPYVTLDVKGASDSVLTEIVRTLYSWEWFSFLNETRSPSCTLPDGSLHRYELFCSMGNGFCFPLETSIFAAACVAACKLAGSPVDFRVYGDDIIVRQDVALLLCEILRSLGFRLNLDKSFIHGPFRESCGANWHREQEVTPVYWRKRITTRAELHAIHNAHYKHPEVQEAIRRFSGETICAVPDNAQYSYVTDQAFRVPHDLCMGNGAVWRRDTQSFRYRTLVSSGVLDESLPAEDRWLRLRHISALRGSTFEDAFPLRKSTRFQVHSPHWRDIECELDKPKKRRFLEQEWSFRRMVLSDPRERRLAPVYYPWVAAALRSALTDLRQAPKLREEQGTVA